MKIDNINITEIEEIFKFYKIASEYQKSKKTVVVWPKFEIKLIETEIRENRQYKLIIEDQIACIWAITFSDAQIWEEKNKDSAIYIHRIATNPSFRGNNFVFKIVKWAKKYATEKNIQFVRLDTLGENVKLIEHYKSSGFNFLGIFDMKNTSNLPNHYHNTPVCLFEIDLYKNKER